MSDAAAKRSVDVLVVDDDDAVRTSLMEVLSTSGLSVEVAGDGDVALDLLAQLDVKVVLLDVRMPKLDGISVLDALDNPPPIVMISAFAHDNDVREHAAGKVCHFLQKPVSPHHLLTIVAEVVRGS